ncbi:ATP-dependent RNA helicase DbpA [bacterium SCN 62-11]|nr:ATP-dependent RNA helicase DbpA [Candidatus Eremiobacteraeota bacterium]ODT74566.1 MAG: ATP-dependent RNA helicase DbpA [bacterium SCN 62-11]
MNFSQLSLPPALLDVLSELKLRAMTEIQEQAIPLLRQGLDLIGQSQTGSGKTLAFALPLLERIQLQQRYPQALVLCPTRELCTQVAREIRKLGRRLPGLQVQILSGGQPIRPQIAALQSGMHIAVATPGRLLDHLDRKTVSLHRVKTVVLDEADRMLDMGFLEDIGKVFDGLPRARQTVFFSATFDEQIEAVSRRFQRNPVRVTVAEVKGSCRQLFYEVADDDQKADALRWLLLEQQPESALVFVRLRATANGVAEQLAHAGLSADALHGDLEQFDRDRALARFRNGSTRVLVATDVAARGLDVLDLPMVVNFDMTSQSDTYVHRIGRTGRAGKSGLAISLGTAREQAKLDTYESQTGVAVERLGYDPDAELATAPPAQMSTLHIWGGRKDKIRPGDILGALTGDLGMSAQDVGKIEIHDRLCYVAVSAALAREAARKLNAGQIKGRKFRVVVLD